MAVFFTLFFSALGILLLMRGFANPTTEKPPPKPKISAELEYANAVDHATWVHDDFAKRYRWQIVGEIRRKGWLGIYGLGLPSVLFKYDNDYIVHWKFAKPNPDKKRGGAMEICSLAEFNAWGPDRYNLLRYVHGVSPEVLWTSADKVAREWEYSLAPDTVPDGAISLVQERLTGRELSAATEMQMR